MLITAIADGVALRPIWIAGAGLSGAVIGRELADAGHDVRIVEERDHVAGNCHTERDPLTGILLHTYGPHIFHTSNEEVWSYITRFGEFVPYRHRVWSTVGNTVYPLPVTLATINQFYGTAFSPAEARDFIASEAQDIAAPANFEEQALSMIGRPLYEAFFRGYTEKQWGRPPRDLPAAILKRLPLRFSYEDGYFSDTRQAMPRQGYTPVVEAILDHPRITLALGRALDPQEVPSGAHLFWSGPLDAYFGHDLGRLGYRTLVFDHERYTGDFQGCPVMNYGDVHVPHTRITEHKHFAPWEDHEKTLVTREYSRLAEPGDVPYYPIRLAEEKAMLGAYARAAQTTRDVTFVGRLGTYRYLDMHDCIREALHAASVFVASEAGHRRMPAFLTPPV